jgi:hypothetical protein
MAALLTVFWGGAPGTRPVFVVEPDKLMDEDIDEDSEPAVIEDDDNDNSGRGTGKTTVVKGIGWLVDGRIDILPGEDFAAIKTRLLSPGGLTKRVGLLDNMKISKFSSSEFEYFVTTDVIDGHQMYVDNGSRPNTLTWFLTKNCGSLSKDGAQRSVVIRVKRPVYSDTWEANVMAYIKENRWDIIGDIIARLKAGGPKLSKYSRWGPWEQEVLACVPDPEACQEEILSRRQQIDGDQDEANALRDAFEDFLNARRHDPLYEKVHIASADAANIYNDANNTDLAPQTVTTKIGDLHIKELRYNIRGDFGRGWVWSGSASKGKPVVKLHTLEEVAEMDRVFAEGLKASLKARRAKESGK